MFNLLITLAVGILIGWNFNSFYAALSSPNIIKNKIEKATSQDNEISERLTNDTFIDSKDDTKPQEIISIKKESVGMGKAYEEDSFYTLLHNDLFSDAMALYMDANDKELITYRSTLEEYFKERSATNTDESIRQMNEYIELEPNNKNIKLLLVKSHKSLSQYKEALEILFELLENASSTDNDMLNRNIMATSQAYIKELKSDKNFRELVNFLENQIEYGHNSSFYNLALAEHLMVIQEYDAAIKILKELEFDESYEEKAKSLLEEIEKESGNKKEYTHKLPLTKNGDHFTVEVNIDDTPLTLLLDTGASLTMVNEDKLSLSKIINDNLTLKTAGGDIVAQLQEAESFTIGDIELKKFQVTTSPFNQKDADGLLGMNFFKKFKFKIDQEEGMLYLSAK